MIVLECNLRHCNSNLEPGLHLLQRCRLASKRLLLTMFTCFHHDKTEGDFEKPLPDQLLTPVTQVVDPVEQRKTKSRTSLSLPALLTTRHIGVNNEINPGEIQ